MQASVLLATRMPGTSSGGLITMHVIVPEWIHTHLLRHGRLAHNWISHRAVRTSRFQNYYTPPVFYESASGMVGGGPVSQAKAETAHRTWTEAVEASIIAAQGLSELGICKQQANRLICPPHYMEGIITATEDAWNAMLRLRDHHDADPAAQHIAVLFREAIASISWSYGTSHYPLWTDDLNSVDPATALLACAARIARISFGSFGAYAKESERGAKLWGDGHVSPFDHLARIDGVFDIRTSRLACERGDLIDDTWYWLSYRAERNPNDLMSHIRNLERLHE